MEKKQQNYRFSEISEEFNKFCEEWHVFALFWQLFVSCLLNYIKIEFQTFLKKMHFFVVFCKCQHWVGSFWAKVSLVQNPGRISGQFGRFLTLFLRFWSFFGAKLLVFRQIFTIYIWDKSCKPTSLARQFYSFFWYGIRHNLNLFQ